MHARLASAVFVAGVASTDTAQADPIWLPGSARRIDHAYSASLDAPLFDAAYGPRAHSSLGLEPAVLLQEFAGIRLRHGFFAMLVLDNVVQKRPFPPNELWRGLLGATAAFETPGLARAWLGPNSLLEWTLSFGHESDHMNGEFSDIGLPAAVRRGRHDLAIGRHGELGEYIGFDIAARKEVGRSWALTVRIADREFFPGASLSRAPAAEVTSEFFPHASLVPVLSAFGESLSDATSSAHPAPLLRVLAGVALIGAGGRLLPYVALTEGYERGYLMNTRVSTASVGIRYTPFRPGI